MGVYEFLRDIFESDEPGANGGMIETWPSGAQGYPPYGGGSYVPTSNNDTGWPSYWARQPRDDRFGGLMQSYGQSGNAGQSFPEWSMPAPEDSVPQPGAYPDPANQVLLADNSPIRGTVSDGQNQNWPVGNGQADATAKKADCPEVPIAPPGVSVDDNIRAELEQDDPFFFYKHVWPGGPWDYKQHGLKYEDFGNFNYGATGAAFGLSDGVIRRGAGAAQMLFGNWSPENGFPLGARPYGDQENDQDNVDAGMQYFKNGCYKK